MQDYSAYGLRVRSAIALPYRLAAPSPDQPDVYVRFGTVPERLESPRRVNPRGIWEAAPDRFLFRVGGIARYLVADGAEIPRRVRRRQRARNRDNSRWFSLRGTAATARHRRVPCERGGDAGWRRALPRRFRGQGSRRCWRDWWTAATRCWRTTSPAWTWTRRAVRSCCRRFRPCACGMKRWMRWTGASARSGG